MVRRSRRKKRAMLGLGTALFMVAAAAMVNVVPSAALDPPPPIVAEPLTPRSVFPDDIDMKIRIKLHHRVVVKVNDPSRTVDVKYTVQPGAQFPWHSHPGPVVVNVVSGALTFLPADTCEERIYSTGQAFVDPGHGHVHTAFNRGTEELVFIATFFEAPAQGPLLIPADPAC